MEIYDAPKLLRCMTALGPYSSKSFTNGINKNTCICTCARVRAHTHSHIFCLFPQCFGNFIEMFVIFVVLKKVLYYQQNNALLKVFGKTLSRFCAELIFFSVVVDIQRLLMNLRMVDNILMCLCNWHFCNGDYFLRCRPSRRLTQTRRRKIWTRWRANMDWTHLKRNEHFKPLTYHHQCVELNFSGSHSNCTVLFLNTSCSSSPWNLLEEGR